MLDGTIPLMIDLVCTAYTSCCLPHLNYSDKFDLLSTFIPQPLIPVKLAVP
ncbi:hypothetical protein [Paenibacillus albiflavus]|uniref:hypothetical protein n=1 Tax=Paenibacillus albiflavus TaxID=2545760 RepID=UPI001404EBF2|nr:hypothetical protein [Paenibacillus albiflavus]